MVNEEILIKELDQISIRFSGDSGDGMQLTGNFFSNLSAIMGNEISTFPDFPAEIRAPQGSLQGVSGYQVRIGTKDVCNPGDTSDVLIAMNPAALKVNINFINPHTIILFDSDSFGEKDLKKAFFNTDDPFKELNIQTTEIFPIPITSLTKETLKDSDMDMKSVLRCKNMFALGVLCWLFDRNIEEAEKLIADKFGKKQNILKANISALIAGYNYGHNLQLSTTIYRVESQKELRKGLYTNIKGNNATAYGIAAAAEKANIDVFLGSYPITPATEILQEMTKMKVLNVKAVQMEDEIAGICSAIGASFGGALAVTSTSGPGLALKSEALGLAVIMELPLVVIDVQRGGPSTGLPTKSEQTDLMQALYGRNGESPIVVLASSTPADCFDMAYWAAKIAVENVTPVILLTEGMLANGSSSWRLPDLDQYPEIHPHTVNGHKFESGWHPYLRDPKSNARYWAPAGTEGFPHIIGGLEKDINSGKISQTPENHMEMTLMREEKINYISNEIPEQEVWGDQDAELLVIGWGSTYGQLMEACKKVQEAGEKIAFSHFRFINPLPRNTESILRKYKSILCVEQNMGQFAAYLQGKFNGLQIGKVNQVKGEPFKVHELCRIFLETINNI